MKKNYTHSFKVGDKVYTYKNSSWGDETDESRVRNGKWN